VQTEIPDTNWRFSRLTFLPRVRLAESSSPSRVRCAAPNTWRALDCSGRLCKFSPLRKKGESQEGKDKIRIYLTSTGILMEGDRAHWPDDVCNGDLAIARRMHPHSIVNYRWQPVTECLKEN